MFFRWYSSGVSGSGIRYHGYGSGNLNLRNSKTQIHASWQFTCLSGGDVTSTLLEGVQAFTFAIDDPDRVSNKPDGLPGFTVSFRHIHPRIIQFVPNPTDIPTIEANSIFWGTPSSRFSPEALISGGAETNHVLKPANSQQKSLKDEFHHLSHFIGQKLNDVKHIAHEALKKCHDHFAPAHRVLDNLSAKFHKAFCSSSKDEHESSKCLKGSSPAPADAAVSLDNPLDTKPQDHLAPTPTIDNIHSTPPSATHTRSLTTPVFPDTTSKISDSNPSLDIDQRLGYLKTLGFLVFVSALLFWIFRRLRDPRWRVDRAACREERRRRFLYKRAARIQAFRNWFCTLRRTYCPSQQTPTCWDEKRARVLGQEDILESVMESDIRTLQRIYHIENNIEAAEEGRNGYIYEVGSSSRSDRRRSVTTLPGYESEATQPPDYDSDTISVVDGFRYIPVENEDTPDSSVISTSPRISRDGRDSDFGKENVTDWTLESTQTYDFRI